LGRRPGQTGLSAIKSRESLPMLNEPISDPEA